ncbi:MAG: bifunctional transaldolase/phosoglucose isomerase [Bacteroidetes bacterium]|nr:bifunctional transaldolase/phosoglucose isomerase [Bacteroidota bacterium]MCL5026486.1 bifunctional transaldolase/phosoglucose isomerase [Chloroflexota bacterium]
MRENPLLKLREYPQSVWMDFVRRSMLASDGELDKLIVEDGVRGVTSNPSIFERAIAGSQDYDDEIRALALEGKSVPEIYQALTVDDIQRACDLFRPIYDQTDGGDGFVSLEVSPHLAHDTERTIAEAHRLWSAVDRPNVMIKIPATQEGMPAIQRCISEGININITLLFGLPRYRQVTEAYIAGLEALAAQGKPLGRVASVASFFLSRIDVLIDPILERVMQAGGPNTDTAAHLHGQVAIASAKVAYQIYKQTFSSDRFRRLAEQGARTQRLVWASTSTKNPAYSDVKYVEPLIGPDTINTMPLETLDAYRDHGQPAPRLEEGVPEAYQVLDQLPEVGIDLDAMTQQLEDEGVHKFIVPYNQLMKTLEEKRVAAMREPVDRQTFVLDGYSEAVRQRMVALRQEQFESRLWRKDASLWQVDPQKYSSIHNSLGWLHVAEKMEDNLDELTRFSTEVRAAGFRQVVHMGMGGSSLAPLTFQQTFTPGDNGLPLRVLDTTDPATILAIERQVPIANTLFIEASKSGTTAEPRAFGEYFYDKVRLIKGDAAGENFVAITDPGTPLETLARERHYRRIFLNFPDIGGRYSALSYFGLVPAALMDLDVAELLERALRMRHACASCVPVQRNAGLILGTVMGEMVLQGRDKVTFLMPEPIRTLGMWLEQLLAESTGKNGTGLLPVNEEPIGDPSVYGKDRLFVHFHLREQISEPLERTLASLQALSHPVATIRMDDGLDLGQEFLRWEIATATAGAILSIDAFDQPNVQESKDNTDRLLQVVREKGRLPEEEPTLAEDTLRYYGPGGATTGADILVRFLGQANPGDYVALMAYLTEDPATHQDLQNMRVRLRDSLRLATTLGYGPRFLHSTGQYHKGGPNTGLFLQLTADPVEDVPIPGQPYTFGVFRQAQALGDLESLRRHGRRAIRIHLGADVRQGLADLEEAVEAALSRLRPAAAA